MHGCLYVKENFTLCKLHIPVRDGPVGVRIGVRACCVEAVAIEEQHIGE